MSTHASAIVAAGAVVPESCTVGPFCTIGPEVVLGEECNLISHVVVDGRTTIGARNVVYPFTSIGVPPQDLKYKNEPTETVVGDGNTIRECVTISRGTVGGGGVTRVGSGNLLMCYVHIGHDSQVGSNCICIFQKDRWQFGERYFSKPRRFYFIVTNVWLPSYQKRNR